MCAPTIFHHMQNYSILRIFASQRTFDSQYTVKLELHQMIYVKEKVVSIFSKLIVYLQFYLLQLYVKTWTVDIGEILIMGFLQ